jgi:hypothetical protein
MMTKRSQLKVPITPALSEVELMPPKHYKLNPQRDFPIRNPQLGAPSIHAVDWRGFNGPSQAKQDACPPHSPPLYRSSEVNYQPDKSNGSPFDLTLTPPLTPPRRCHPSRSPSCAALDVARSADWPAPRMDSHTPAQVPQSAVSAKACPPDLTLPRR